VKRPNLEGKWGFCLIFERKFEKSTANLKKSRIFAKNLRSQAAPQQLKYISLHSACTDFGQKIT
jgi:hypothetical protein